MYKTGATGGNVQTPGDIRIPTLQIPDLSIDWGKMKQGFELGRRMATAKKDREDELKMKDAQIKQQQASADMAFMEADKQSKLLQSQIAAGLATNAFNTEKGQQELSNLVSNRDRYKAIAEANARKLETEALAAAEIAPTGAATAANQQRIAGEVASRQLEAVKNLPPGVLSDANVTISGGRVEPTKLPLAKPTVVGFGVQQLKGENGETVLGPSGRPMAVKVINHSDGTSTPEGSAFEIGGSNAHGERKELSDSPIGYLADLSPNYPSDPVAARNLRAADTKRTNELNESLAKAERAASAARRFMEVNAREDTGGIQGSIQGGRKWLKSADTQELDSLAASMGVESVVKGQGSVSNQERELYARRQPGISNEKSVNDNLNLGIIAIAEREKEKQKFLSEWKRLDFGPMSGAEVWWNEYMEANPVITEGKDGSIVINNNRQTWNEYFESRNPAARPGEVSSKKEPAVSKADNGTQIINGYPVRTKTK